MHNGTGIETLVHTSVTVKCVCARAYVHVCTVLWKGVLNTLHTSKLIRIVQPLKFTLIVSPKIFIVWLLFKYLHCIVSKGSVILFYAALPRFF